MANRKKYWWKTTIQKTTNLALKGGGKVVENIYKMLHFC
jgi:hypothetical protein